MCNSVATLNAIEFHASNGHIVYVNYIPIKQFSLKNKDVLFILKYKKVSKIYWIKEQSAEHSI